MKRSIGVTLSAILTILGATALLLLAALMLATLFVQRSQPAPSAFVRWSVLVFSFLLLVFAAWGIATAVGLFRLRAWSRWSILVFSGLLATFGGLSVLMVAILPMPPPPDTPANIWAVVLIGFVSFYALLALIGGWWLYFFNAARTKAQFAAGGAPATPPHRPVSVSVIAGLLLFGALTCLVFGFLPFPAALFGMVVTGWPARIAYLAISVIQLGLAVGLLRLQPLSRTLAIAYFAYGVVNLALLALLPGYSERIAAASMSILPAEVLQAPAFNSVQSMWACLLFGLLFNGLAIWFLIRRREAFVKPAAGNA